MNEDEKLERRLRKLDRSVVNGLFVLFTQKICVDALEGHTGGFLSSLQLHADSRETTITNKFGRFESPELTNEDKFRFLSQTERAQRLKKNIGAGHLTSYESRNTSAYVCMMGQKYKWGQRGGSILSQINLILSCSGLPELVGEAFVCFVGLRTNLMSRKQFKAIKEKRADNPHLKLL